MKKAGLISLCIYMILLLGFSSIANAYTVEGYEINNTNDIFIEQVPDENVIILENLGAFGKMVADMDITVTPHKFRGICYYVSSTGGSSGIKYRTDKLIFNASNLCRSDPIY